MVMNHNFIDLKRWVSIEAVLRDKGIDAHFRKRGDRLQGPCPVHGGDNPNAFVVSISKNQWYCFSKCCRGGDVIELVRFLDNINYREVAQYLSQLAGRQPPSAAKSSKQSSPVTFRPYTSFLPLSSEASFIQKKGIKPETARFFEAGAYNGKGFLNHCVGVRLHDLAGRPIGYAGRRLDHMQVKQYGKWKLPKGLPKNLLLYNFHRVRKYLKNGLFVVESPWSVMRLAQLNIPAVALLGVNLSDLQKRILIRAHRLILMLDGDETGRKATGRLMKQLNNLVDLQYIVLPNNCDPDDLSDTNLSAITRSFLF